MSPATTSPEISSSLSSAVPAEVLQLDVSGVTVVYPNGLIAIRDASFALSGGCICGLVGVNGSGKSTLFKAIMGLLEPAAGAVRIDGRPVRESLKQNGVAYVPQAEEVDWTFPVSVWDVVMMGRYGHMNLLQIARAADRRMAAESLDRVGMAEFRDRQIGELSGGQRKRVFLARALAQRARVVLLDEPFTGVDLNTESAIVALLRELREEGRIMLVSTHNLGAVPEFCDQAVLVNRRVLAAGPTDEVFTEENLQRAFLGVLRHFRFDESTVQKHDGRQVTLLTDDERPLVIGEGGHVEYRKHTGHEDVVRGRAEGEEDV